MLEQSTLIQGSAHFQLTEGVLGMGFKDWFGRLGDTLGEGTKPHTFCRSDKQTRHLKRNLKAYA